MSYTFLDMQNKLSSLLGDANTSTDDQFPLADRKKELNRGEMRFCRDSKALQEYVTGTISGTSISIPSDWMETFVLIIDDVVITNDREVSLTEWERYKDAGTTDPYYYVWNFSGTKQMRFFSNSSVTGKTYKLFYFKKPSTDLDDDTDVSIIPDEYREAVVYYAASELLNQIGKTELATVYYQKYLAITSQASDDAERQYVNKERAMPDFGEGYYDNEETDHQGQGRIY